MQCFTVNRERYFSSLHEFQTHSQQEKKTKEWLDQNLPRIIRKIKVEDRQKTFRVIGVGSGDGAIDLKIIKVLLKNRPAGIERVACTVIEPWREQIETFQERVQIDEALLKNVSFDWQMKTSESYQANQIIKMVDNKMMPINIVHLIEMLYFIEDVEETIMFYYNLLQQGGAMILQISSPQSGLVKVGEKFESELPVEKSSLDVRQTLEDCKLNCHHTLNYHHTRVEHPLDITECFDETSPPGSLLLDFVSKVSHFRKVAPLPLKKEFMEYLRYGECTYRKNGRVLFRLSFDVYVLYKE